MSSQIEQISKKKHLKVKTKSNRNLLARDDVDKYREKSYWVELAVSVFLSSFTCTLIRNTAIINFMICFRFQHLERFNCCLMISAIVFSPYAVSTLVLFQFAVFRWAKYFWIWNLPDRQRLLFSRCIHLEYSFCTAKSINF